MQGLDLAALAGTSQCLAHQAISCYVGTLLTYALGLLSVSKSTAA